MSRQQDTYEGLSGSTLRGKDSQRATEVSVPALPFTPTGSTLGYMPQKTGGDRNIFYETPLRKVFFLRAPLGSMHSVFIRLLLSMVCPGFAIHHTSSFLFFYYRDNKRDSIYTLHLHGAESANEQVRKSDPTATDDDL